jgi:hypothetical protein
MTRVIEVRAARERLCLYSLRLSRRLTLPEASA